MIPLLPPQTDYAAYQRFKLDPASDWRAIAREIAGRHRLKFESATRFSSGENPVLDLDGRYVIKLVPTKFWPRVIRREVDALTFLRGKDLPVSELIGHGEIDGWAYLVCTQLPGESFRTVWPRLAPAEKRKAAGAFGALLAALHRLPVGNTRPGGITWENFLRENTSDWRDRWSVQALPAGLRETGVPYLRAARLEEDDSPVAFLHGDLALENCLVTAHGVEWKFSGLFDFGNALVGRASFDLAAPVVLMAPLDGETLREFLAGYGHDAAWLEQQRHRLMAYTLLHPLGNMAALLELIPAAKHATSWEELAAMYWPA